MMGKKEVKQKVLDYIEDIGLEEIAEYYKDLEEVRVFPYMQQPNISLTERGLVPISAGFPKLHSVLYFCRQMANAALVTTARNRPNLIQFHLCLVEPQSPDYLTLGLLDTVFGAIVHHCKGLRRLSPSDLLTDHVFHYIGTHSKKLEMLSVLFAVNSNLGLHCVLSGCESFYKLEIRDCPFGEKALLVNAARLEMMRYLWMSSCSVSYGLCKLLTQKLLRFNAEVIDESRKFPCRETLHKQGQRFAMLDSVCTVDGDPAASISHSTGNCSMACA